MRYRRSLDLKAALAVPLHFSLDQLFQRRLSKTQHTWVPRTIWVRLVPCVPLALISLSTQTICRVPIICQMLGNNDSSPLYPLLFLNLLEYSIPKTMWNTPLGYSPERWRSLSIYLITSELHWLWGSLWKQKLHRIPNLVCTKAKNTLPQLENVLMRREAGSLPYG